MVFGCLRLINSGYYAASSGDCEGPQVHVFLMRSPSASESGIQRNPKSDLEFTRINPSSTPSFSSSIFRRKDVIGGSAC